MTNNERTYTGFADMADTAVAGPALDEHQGKARISPPETERTPSEASIPPRGTGYVGDDVGSTAPGAGTSSSGAGAPPGQHGGTMTQGVWHTPARR